MPGPRRTTPAARRRASHSMEAVLAEAVALLDEAGEAALTFRALAARLGGGVASIYWYVSSKEELLDRATDHVLAGVVATIEAYDVHDDPVEDLRAIALAIFAAVADRPWLGAFLMRDTGAQANGMVLYDRLGQQAMRLGLEPRDCFHATSAVLGYVLGIAADMGQGPPPEVLDGTVRREDYLAQRVEEWRETDPQGFPFLHYVADEFAGHDDTEQFRAGLDLLLAGIRLQAGR